MVSLFCCLPSSSGRCVFLGLAARWFVIRSWFSGRFKSWQLIANGFVFVSHLCCSLSQFPGFRLGTSIRHVHTSREISGNVVLFAWSMPEDALDAVARRLGGCFGNPAEVGDPQTGRLDRFCLLGAVWVVVLAAD